MASVTFTKRVLLIVPAAEQAQANQTALQWDPLGGAQTFTVGLSGNGQNPPSHYWASAQMQAQVWAAIQAILPQFAGATAAEYDLDADPGFPDRMLNQLGLQRIAAVH